MTVNELIARLQEFDADLPVELKAYCCTHTHPIKVEASYSAPKSEGPSVSMVVISDESIDWYDEPSDKVISPETRELFAFRYTMKRDLVRDKERRDAQKKK